MHGFGMRASVYPLHMHKLYNTAESMKQVQQKLDLGKLVSTWMGIALSHRSTHTVFAAHINILTTEMLRCIATLTKYTTFSEICLGVTC